MTAVAIRDDAPSYGEFLAAKAALATPSGLECEPGDVHPMLKPHQRDTVVWAVRGGRRAVFASFGLGKTLIQLEIVRLCLAKSGGQRGLIVLPLGVRQEFIRDARLIDLAPRFIRSIDEAAEPGIYLTNYETVRDGKLDPRGFDVVSLDEAAVLRGFGGTKTFREFMRLYEGSSRYRFVATATPSPNEYIELLAYAAFLDVMDVGQAKAQPLDAKVLTPTGWTTIGELRVGDEVIASDGRPTAVLGIYPQGDRQIYRVTFSDGATTECTADHLWLTTTQYERNNERRYLQRDPAGDRRYASVKSAALIRETLSDRHAVPLVGAVQMAAQPVTIDPWLLGLLIGDGTLRETSVNVSSADPWVLERVAATIAPALALRQINGVDYGITTSGRQGGRGPGSNPLLNALRDYGLTGKRAWEKRIPATYLSNTLDVRLAVLQGLMDADGTIHGDGTMARLTTTSPRLADDVQSLVRSLGGTATIRRRSTTHRDAYTVLIRLPNGISPFALPRKAERVRSRDKYPPVRFITSIEPVGVAPAQCIAIEHPDRLYVTDDYVLTHNTRFFKRDSEKADALTLHGHMEEEFWLWVASWAMFLHRPSDLGYSDEGYVLPELDVRWHELPAPGDPGDFDRHGRGRMFRNAALGVQEAAREKRGSIDARVAAVARLVAEMPAGDQVVVWCDLNDEQRALERALGAIGATVTSLYGADGIEDREARIQQWRDRETRVFLSKPSMYGAGVNLQQAHRMVFAGIGFRFAQVIQAIHREHRFLQAHPVVVDLIYTEAEREIRIDLERKWAQHNAMVARMGEIIREYGLAHEAMSESLRRSIGVERQEVAGDGFRLVNADAVEETATMPADSVDLIVTSIPFATQYEYTPSYNDFGHTEDNGHFWAQMDYLTPELLRVLQPGRVAAIHVKDRIVPGGLTGLGFQTVQPFHAEAIAHYTRHGFAFLGMKTIVTDVVRENNQTYRLGWTEQCKDGSRMGAGLPEYLLIFRKPPTDSSRGYADRPVVKSKAEYSRSRWQVDAHGFMRSNGNRPLTPEDLEGLAHDQIFRLFREHGLTNVYDFEEHIALSEAMEAKGGLPVTFMLLQPPSWHPEVWTDVARMRTLNLNQHQKGQEYHLCPLQFDIVDRLVTQYSMPGETVFDPFGGLMTVPYCAVKLGRRGVGVELNPTYFRDGVAYVQSAAIQASAPTLFDLVAAEAELAS